MPILSGLVKELGSVVLNNGTRIVVPCRLVLDLLAQGARVTVTARLREGGWIAEESW